MPLRIRDGYTLPGKTSGMGFSNSDALPVVNFEYRPPLAKEIAELRKGTAPTKTADEEHAARCNFVVARLVKWDVLGGDDKPYPINFATVASLPEEILADLVSETMKWRPKPEEEARGN